MTANGGSTPPYSPSGGPFVPSPGPPLPPQPGFTSGGARPLGAGIAIALATVAVVLAAAALVVALVRVGDSSPPASPAAQPIDVADSRRLGHHRGGKALCEAIAPLMTESNDQAKHWVEPRETREHPHAMRRYQVCSDTRGLGSPSTGGR